MFVAWKREARAPWAEFTDLTSTAVGFSIGLWFFFTLGTRFSGTGFAHFVGQPFDYLTDP
jgi:hypothetical protein